MDSGRASAPPSSRESRRACPPHMEAHAAAITSAPSVAAAVAPGWFLRPPFQQSFTARVQKGAGRSMDGPQGRPTCVAGITGLVTHLAGTCLPPVAVPGVPPVSGGSGTGVPPVARTEELWRRTSGHPTCSTWMPGTSRTTASTSTASTCGTPPVTSWGRSTASSSRGTRIARTTWWSTQAAGSRAVTTWCRSGTCGWTRTTARFAWTSNGTRSRDSRRSTSIGSTSSPRKRSGGSTSGRSRWRRKCAHGDTWDYDRWSHYSQPDWWRAQPADLPPPPLTNRPLAEDYAPDVAGTDAEVTGYAPEHITARHDEDLARRTDRRDLEGRGTIRRSDTAAGTPPEDLRPRGRATLGIGRPAKRLHPAAAAT